MKEDELEARLEAAAERRDREKIDLKLLIKLI
jgi:hypothetical protein